MDVVNSDGKLVGTSTGVTELRATLAYNSRTWDERIKVVVATVTGDADGTTLQAPLSCVVAQGGGNCQPTGRGSWAGQDGALLAVPGASYSGSLWFTSPVPDTTWMYFEVNMNFQPPDANPVPITIGPTETIRCDSLAIFRPTKGGCVFFYAVMTSLEISLKDHTVTKAAEFIAASEKALPHHPGVPEGGSALTRLTNRSAIRRNRRAACTTVKVQKGQSCDEYPFASTYQGAALAGPDHYKSRGVPADQNSKVGSYLGRFYLRYRIADGDPFYVKIVG